MTKFSSLQYKSASIEIPQTSSFSISHDQNFQRSNTGCGKCLQFTVKLIGYFLVCCLLGSVGLYSYIFIRDLSWFKLHCTSNDIASTKNNKVLPSTSAGQCSVDENNRFDCFPESHGASPSACQSRGCCWKESSKPNTAPFCFYPSDYSGYSATNVSKTSTGISAVLRRTSSAFFPGDVKVVQLQVEFQTNTRLRIRISDPNNPRFEVPLDTPTGTVDISDLQYTVSIQQNPFNIVVKRRSTGATIFDTTNTAPLTFTDQFLQIATQLSTKYLYGFGEHRGNFLQDVSSWKRLVFWTRDEVPKVDNNGYGSHPFFLNLETGGPASNSYAHGVFLLNSNAGEVVLSPFGPSGAGAVTYHFLGGILDFYLLLGPDPISVVSQYSEVIGRPYFPPFWSLGYHLCKWGYNSSDGLKAVIDRNRQAQIPYDVQWNDIDYMDNHKDWTYDTTKFASLPAIVKDLHINNQRYVIMADPAISSEQPSGTYPPYDTGVSLDVFVKNATGSILIGQVWPGKTAFPDFFHPDAVYYWHNLAKDFHQKIPFDGLWIDMNEPSSFIDGSTTGCTTNSLDNPPFIPPTLEGGSLMSKTLCPSAKHVLSSHYNLHNMYGWSQAHVTRSTLNLLLKKRSPIITRSSYPGSGKNVGHWLGDNHSSFSELFYSIPGILNFNLFGIPQIGADICGFGGATTPELCTRWHQLAAFYPFMRNHADISSPDQDPASFQQPYRDYIKAAIELRYRLLAVLYTAFFKAHTQGLPIVRPLFYLYPGTEAIDKQFMWGEALLVIPVLDEGATSVSAFIPSDIWYSFDSGVQLSQSGQYTELSASLASINVFVRGGSILPLLPVTQRSDLSRKEKFQLLVAVGANGGAEGELFWDDGESFNSILSNKYTDITFTLTNANKLVSFISRGGFNPPEGVWLGSVTFYGIRTGPKVVSVNGSPANFMYDTRSKVLQVSNLNENLLNPLTVLLS